ncbi:hypothetical protein HGRIS_000491 [Hohenbuehelia grisea]|uniref:Glutathione S-transferase n=1 Tax=Hohenbuehelia grisea TaxID=104357 RepID=A0ABR3JT71_9AGAR
MSCRLRTAHNLHLKASLSARNLTFVDVYAAFILSDTWGMLIVHHLNDSRSQRILWLLEELEVPYEIKRYDRTKEGRAPKELFEVSPLGKSPVISDGDVVLAESGAIVEYVIGKYGKDKIIVPESGRLDHLYFTHYAEGSLMPILVQGMVNRMVPQQSPFFVRPFANLIFGQLDKGFVQPELKRHLSFIESHLEKANGGWFAGGSEPSAADYMMAFPLEALDATDSKVLGPKCLEYVRKVHARPAYKRALERGGSYAYARL